MRNRGIELFLLPPEAEAEAGPGAAAQLAAAPPAGAPAQQQQQEAQQVLALAGVPGSAVPAAMAAAHAAVVAHAAQRHRRPPGLRELRRWAALAAALAARGWPFGRALHTAWGQLYVRPEAAGAAGADEAAAVAEAAFEAYVLPALQAGGASRDAVLHRPAAWPLPLGVAAFADDSLAAGEARDAALLTHQLALLAAAELAEQGGSAAAAGAASARDAWVGELGLAAASATPAAALLQLLTGGAADGGEAAAIDSEAALLCAPAAAHVFVERCGVQQGRHRAAYVAALSAQLQKLLAAGGSSAGSTAVQAAQQAEQLVAGVLSHPLITAAAVLQRDLTAAVRLPAADAAFLPLDAAAAQQLQPCVLAAGLQQQAAGSSGGSPLWAAVQETGAKLAALWHAVHAAVVLRSAADAADDAIADGSATLLQLSAWRHQRPKVGRSARLAGVALLVMQPSLPPSHSSS